MQFLHLCVILFSALTMCHGQCAYSQATVQVVNGYISDTSGFQVTGNGVAAGYLGYSCNSGFALNPAIGSRLTCQSNGIWTTLPVCQSTGRCPAGPLFAFLQNLTVAVTLTASTAYSLPTDGVNNTNVISGAFLPVTCNSGYVNVGGPLNITCINGSWTPLPNCVSTSGGGGGVGIMTTMAPGSGGGAVTTAPPTTSGQCPYNSATFTIANGFPSNTSNLMLYPATSTASGSVVFSCTAGFALDPTVGAVWSCINGVWTTQPRCLSTGRCQLSALTTFLSTAVGIQNNGPTQLLQLPSDPTTVLSGSFVAFSCASGYTNTGGSLNLTCNANGSWSPLPNCMLNSAVGGGGVMTTMAPGSGGGGATTTAPPTTSGQCPYNSATFTIANGFPSNTNNLMLYPATSTASGSVVFSCNTGFTLDPTVGAVWSCINGVWTTQPRCLSTARCQLSALTTFLSTATGIQTVGQPQLSQLSSDPTTVLSGSFVVFSCASGYTNTGGSLNLTCNANGSWSPLPNCMLNSAVGGGGVMTTMAPGSGGGGATTTAPPTTSGQCPYNSATFTIANGFPSNTSNLMLYPATSTASGSVVFSCNTGFTLDPTVGAVWSCINGVWTTQPRCLSTGRCQLSALTSFLSTATGIQTVGQPQISQLPSDPTTVLSGSFVVFSCASGYTNTGGSLNLSCSANGAWSQLPNCMLNSAVGGGGMMTTMAPGSGGVVTTAPPSATGQCPFNSATFTIANGYPSNTGNLALNSVTSTASGSVVFSCNTGFTLDPTVGAVWSCINGVWTTQPRCLSTGRCQLSALVTFLSTAVGIQTVGQPQLSQLPSDPTTVLSGSFVAFSCASGYTNTGGSLNLTCNANGSWSPLPNCVLGSSGSQTTVPGSGGQMCPYSSALLTIPNGYASNYNNLILASSTQAMAGSYIDFLCNPSFTLAGNSRVTCVNGAFTAQPVCNAAGVMTTTVPLSSVSCTGIPSVANAYVSNATLINFGNNNYQGAVDFTCNPGFTRVNTTGRRWVNCTNGVWSTLPVCAPSPVCSFSQLQTSIASLTVVSQALSTSNGGILAGGWIMFACRPGLNVNPFSAPFNVTCQSTGIWSTFPLCT